jgi:hypothetical protein
MLTKLLPEQISDYWDIVKHAISESLPPTAGEGPGKMNRILSALLASKAECWISSTIEGDVRKFEGVVITKLQYDDISNTRNLLMYCLYGYEDVSKESWTKGLKTLVKYASSKECYRILAYTDIPYMIEMANKLGGEAKYTLSSFPLV